MWLTYLQLQASAGDLDYDLAVSAQRGLAPSPVDAGIQSLPVAPPAVSAAAPAAVVPEAVSIDARSIDVAPPADGRSLWPFGVGAVAGVLTFGAVLAVRRMVRDRGAVA